MGDGGQHNVRNYAFDGDGALLIRDNWMEIINWDGWVDLSECM